MIAKGNLHGSGVKLTDYLLRGEEGERVEFGGVRGFDDYNPNLRQAAARMQQFAEATTRAEMPWFHAQTRLAPGEQLTNAQWERVLDREEKRLGFTGHARLWSFHVNEATGEKHLHAAWFRLDPESGRAHDPGLFKNHLMQLSRQLEQEFGLRELSNEREPHDTARAPERKEMEESRRLGTDVRAIRAAILDCLEHSDNGKALKAALEERSLMLANGDRRDCFVVIDQEGGQHALNKKLTGQTLEQTRVRLADLDRSTLPGVEQAQAMQRGHQAERTPEPEKQPEQESSQPRRYDELRETERRVETERAFEAAEALTTEPAAPIWDRDAAARTADEQIIEAAIRAKAQKGREPSQAEIETSPQAQAAAAPAQEQAVEETPDLDQLADGIEAALGTGSRAATKGLAGLAKAIEKVLSGVFDFFGGGEPKLTRQQQHEKAQAEGNEETLHARTAAEAEAAKTEEQHWLIIEAQRTRDIARTQGIETTGDPEEERFREIMQRVGRERERDRGDYELER